MSSISRTEYKYCLSQSANVAFFDFVLFLQLFLVGVPSSKNEIIVSVIIKATTGMF